MADDRDGGADGSRERIRRIVASYDRRVIRWYCRARFLILRQRFLEEIGQYLPESGRVLDLGCGFGLFSLYFASVNPNLEIHGIDANASRIHLAGESARKLGVANVHYRQLDVRELVVDDGFDAIYMLDLVHHIPSEAVAGFLDTLAGILKPGGRLIIKDVEPTPWHKMLFTLILDRLMAGWRDPIRYWPRAELKALLAERGFRTYHHTILDYLPYPHILYVGEKRAMASAGGVRP